MAEQFAFELAGQSGYRVWEHYTAAWRLYSATGQEKYREDYHRIWGWCWTHLVDHNYGAWYRLLNRNGSTIDNKKSPLGKTDYHTMGACWDVLSVLGVSS